jgi:iron(III) transport system ATP-binding protein
VTGIRVRGLTKAFDATPVLTGVDLDVAPGSLTAVLGPSGCGKTTLLRIVAGFEHAGAGTVELGDRTVIGPGGSLPARARRVGYVPQEGALFPHLSVAANVLFGLPRAERRRGERLDALFALVGLDPEVGERSPDQLSGGQQQRAALARALAPSPAVVLLDEPFSSLDAGLREDTGRAVAAALRTTGATAVLVTHDQGEALSLADQVAVMRDGRLVQAGAPAVVYRSPVDAGVACFVGGAVLLPAVVRDGRARCALGPLEVAGPAADGPGQVLVRPEQVRLGPGGVRARVTGLSWYGHDASVRLELIEGGTAVLARVSGLAVPGAGEEVGLSVDGPVPVFPAGELPA